MKLLPTLAQQEISLPGPGLFLTLAVVGVLALVTLILVFNYGSIWLRAQASGASVGIVELLALSLRKVPVGSVVDNRITAMKSGLEVSIDQLSTHHLSGGSINMVVQALIAAQKAGIHLDFDRACAIDLATKGTGKTVLEAVRTSVNPKVIDCPAPQQGKVTIEAVAKDGIAVKVKARVTVRTNLDRFVGGATEETIIARVGEGIVTTIGSSETYKEVLENPDRISKNVLSKALDSNTAFEILSIDIADVDVGENVGAKLQAEQAEANKLIAQAQALEAVIVRVLKALLAMVPSWICVAPVVAMSRASTLLIAAKAWSEMAVDPEGFWILMVSVLSPPSMVSRDKTPADE